jgi:DNA modification methylase
MEKGHERCNATERSEYLPIRSTIHPTQKPVALFEYLIRTYTKPSELVLDNYIGSCATAIACINLIRLH